MANILLLWYAISIKFIDFGYPKNFTGDKALRAIQPINL